jgi:hypothetical protein
MVTGATRNEETDPVRRGRGAVVVIQGQTRQQPASSPGRAPSQSSCGSPAVPDRGWRMHGFAAPRVSVRAEAARRTDARAHTGQGRRRGQAQQFWRCGRAARVVAWVSGRRWPCSCERCCYAQAQFLCLSGPTRVRACVSSLVMMARGSGRGAPERSCEMHGGITGFGAPR